MAIDPLDDAGLARLRRKISDEGESAFSDEDLQDIYQEADGNFTLTIAIAFEELAGSATRLADYTQNQSSEKRSQVYDHLKDRAQYYRGLYNSETKSSNTMQMVKLQTRPKPKRAEPRG